jgi:hypothetical protein
MPPRIPPQHRRSVPWRALCVVAMLCIAANAGSAERPGTEADRLIDLIFDDRAQNGMTAIPISPSLVRVSRAHTADLERHTPKGRCNLHSWSDSGTWSPCCYTDDHRQARCMWDKPREISHGEYAGDGFEIVCFNSEGMTADAAMQCWRASARHHHLLLNRGVWRDTTWRAMGVAVSAHYAVLWLGQDTER